MRVDEAIAACLIAAVGVSGAVAVFGDWQRRRAEKVAAKAAEERERRKNEMWRKYTDQISAEWHAERLEREREALDDERARMGKDW